MRNRIIILLATLALPVLTLLGGNVRISVEPDRGKRNIEIGDKFYVYIEVSNMDGTPELTAVPGGKVMYFAHMGQSSSMTSVNGRVTQTSSNTYTATVRAVKEGSYTLGPIVVDGVKSNQVRYSIGKESSGNGGASGNDAGGQGSASGDGSDGKPKFIGKGDGNLFLRASVSTSQVYEQQALVYTVKLYTTYDGIRFIGATSAPKFDGFTVEESKDISHSLTFETYNGKSYATAVIARYVIFPQMTGQLKVTGNTYTVSVDQREYYRDPFWGSMSISKPLQLNVTPNDLVVNVKGLPLPKPVDFSGGVGQFSIQSQLKTREFKTNQAASIVYTVSGTGNIKYIQLPELSTVYPSELEVYSPTSDIKASVNGGNVSGTASFDYSFMPLEEGNFTIPEVKLVYFNPETGKYETAVAQGYNLQVGKGQSSSKSQTSSRVKFDSKLEKIDLSDLSKTHEPLIYKWYYWLWYILPVVLLGGSFVWYRRYLALHADLGLLNSKRANKMANRRLRRAAACMKRGDRDAFYDELLEALWGYLSEKLRIPGSELMRDNIRQILADKGVSGEEVEKLMVIIDKCEYAKYSPDTDGDGMSEAYGASINIINSLEKTFKSLKTA